jgi:ribosomal protein S27AE
MKKSEKMLSSKQCPKCFEYSIYLDSDEYGRFQHCWQCGYIKDLPKVKVNHANWFGLNKPGQSDGLV